jgi:UDP-N-acetylmuramoyl-L-alanyl-D-glutamate--2,6-diaminopimelate ligase
VTGTNGKTSTVTFVAAMLRALGPPVPSVTTLGRFLDGEPLETAEGYAGFLETMRRGFERGARAAAIELTSEALGLGFAVAWPCRVGVFTNLTRDHFDAHGSAEHYLACKAQLFAHLPAGGAAVLNACDPAGALLAEVVPPGARVLTYAVASRGAPWADATVAATRVDVSLAGTTVELAWRDRPPGDAPDRLVSRAIGEVFAENALAALLAALAAGVAPADAARALAACPAPRGRFEPVCERPYGVVDYAHTPDAVARTVATARAVVGGRGAGGRVIMVLGAGGDRDRGKRPLMGAAAAGADRVVFTSDNPRGEDPAAICAALRSGAPAGADAIVELDRARAIERAVAEAAPEDLVVVAGKGHERGQIVGTTVRPFSDIEALRAAHARRAAAG